MADQTLHVSIRGKVQGVSYRYYTKKRADELSLSGWVRNCPDGTVESLISGNANNIELMKAWFIEGSPLSSVREVITKQATSPSTSGHFLITY